MKDVKIYVTENCNLRCDYCFVDKSKNRAMTMETLDKTIRFLLDSKEFINITFFGGEPLLEFEKIKNVVYRLKDCRERFHFTINTNLTLLNKEMTEYFKNNEFTVLYSIDGKRKSHDLHRKTINGEGTFDNIISKCKMLKKYEIDSVCKIVITPQTVEELFESVEYLEGIGVTRLYVDIARQLQWKKEELEVLKEEFIKIAKWITNKQIKLMNFSKKNNKRLFCGAGSNQIAIDVKGNIYPCYRLIYDQFLLGNVEDNNYIEKGNIFMNEISKQLNSCNYNKKSRCNQFCAAVNYEVNNKISDKADINCEFHNISREAQKIYYEDAISKYIESKVKKNDYNAV